MACEKYETTLVALLLFVQDKYNIFLENPSIASGFPV